MKKQTRLIALTSLFILASSSLFIFSKSPADDKPETITVKTMEGDFLDKAVVEVIYGGDKIDIQKFSFKENLDLQTLNIIQKLNSDGYKVISESSYVKLGGGGTVAISSKEFETWVLEKR